MASKKTKQIEDMSTQELLRKDEELWAEIRRRMEKGGPGIKEQWYHPVNETLYSQYGSKAKDVRVWISIQRGVAPIYTLPNPDPPSSYEMHGSIQIAPGETYSIRYCLRKSELNQGSALLQASRIAGRLRSMWGNHHD